MNNYFFMVPNVVFQLGLDKKEILVYCCLLMHANAEGKAWPSQETIAKECGMSDRTVQVAIKSLYEKDLITNIAKRNYSHTPVKSNIYTIRLAKDFKYGFFVKSIKGGKFGSTQIEFEGA